MRARWPFRAALFGSVLLSACSLIVEVDGLSSGPPKGDAGETDTAADGTAKRDADAAPSPDATAIDAGPDAAPPPTDAGPSFCLSLDAGGDGGMFCADFDDDAHGIGSFTTSSFTNATFTLSDGGLSAPNGLTARLQPNGQLSALGYLQQTPPWPTDGGMRRLRVEVALRGADPYSAQTVLFLGNTTTDVYVKLQVGALGELKVEENYVRPDGGNANRDRNIGELAGGWNTIVLNWDFVSRTSSFLVNGVDKGSGVNDFRGELLTRQVRLGLISSLAGDGGPLEMQFDNLALQWE